MRHNYEPFAYVQKWRMQEILNGALDEAERSVSIDATILNWVLDTIDAMGITKEIYENLRDRNNQ